MLDNGGIAVVFDSARQMVIDSAPYRDALQSAPETLDPYRAAISRAIVATAIHQCNQEERFAAIATDAQLRDAIVVMLSNQLGPADMSIGGWMARQLFGLAQRMGAMNHVQRRRGAITDAAYPGAGDVLLYQARGEAIRDFIRDTVKQHALGGDPIVLLAHSLGGIACVDLLVQEHLPEVKLLVTVGSQAPFLYEIGALYSLQYGEPLPPQFPSWLNIYDLRDFLSYIGAAVFPDRVQDVLVDSKQPFPQAHSAYWTNQATWKAILSRLP